MKNQKWIVFSVALALIAGTVGAIAWLKTHQTLGKPGIRAEPIPGSVRMKINLPARVLDFTSTNVPEPEVVLGYLPHDTSYVERLYSAPNDFQVTGTIVLMGADRTSIHKPDYCLPGQGWTIKKREVVNIPVSDSGSGAPGYQLPVAKWTIGNMLQTPDGKKVAASGLYVFWFVADGEQTPSNYKRMWWLGRDLLTTGVLQRWAYISYFAICAPGKEDAAFARMKKLIAASVPEFQLNPHAK
ncbi:MAG: exosortase-associated EpsI family protein [Limisphaerales bacterium]